MDKHEKFEILYEVGVSYKLNNLSSTPCLGFDINKKKQEARAPLMSKELMIKLILKVETYPDT